MVWCDIINFIEDGDNNYSLDDNEEDLKIALLVMTLT